MLQENQMKKQGLYDPQFEHDNCGIGAVVNIKGIKTRETVDNALKIVENLEHRAGKDAEGKTGDGVGIMLQVSHKFFKKVCQKENITIGEERDYGVGMFFFPQDELQRNQAKKLFEVIVQKEGMKFLGWRKVPTHPEILGSVALVFLVIEAIRKKPINREIEGRIHFAGFALLMLLILYVSVHDVIKLF